MTGISVDDVWQVVGQAIAAQHASA
jgi:hypothetical protein